ncbi:MAG: retention module-containing protein, partial [Desulfobulbaceae bacterium]|nr:retention module-containing protein [Desulfobulbaceae bacterium]
MASNEDSSTNETSGRPIGKMVVVFGTATAISPDGTERVLKPNSPIFMDDRIVTGGDGRVSIIFNDPGETRLDLGRNSDITIDEDVFEGGPPADLSEMVSEVEDIQQAILEGELDPNALPSPAAGSPGGRGGGHPYSKFALTGDEVIPDAGAETTGVEL